uniref:ARF related protein 1 n=1 Tax=Canis lupus familiaris TaxID=9615 RepID=A0A8C0RSI4_CANLF
MYTLLSGLYKYMFQKDEYCVLILGLDNAGKTTFLEQSKTRFNKNYKGMSLSKITTTVGLNIGTVDVGKARLMFWDLGGQEELQSLWDKVTSSPSPRPLPSSRLSAAACGLSTYQPRPQASQQMRRGLPAPALGALLASALPGHTSKTIVWPWGISGAMGSRQPAMSPALVMLSPRCPAPICHPLLGHHLPGPGHTLRGLWVLCGVPWCHLRH